MDRIERMLSNWDGSTRRTVDKAYLKIIKSMFETLDACAAQEEAKNMDEKDSLNNHILSVGISSLHRKYAPLLF